jgi:hypothetical protein
MARRQPDHDHRKDRFQIFPRQNKRYFADLLARPKSSTLILAVFSNPANWLANGPSEVARCCGGNTWEMPPQYLQSRFKAADIACEISFCVKELKG